MKIQYRVMLVCLIGVLASTLWAVAPNSVVATFPTGVTPAGLAITPDNRFAYVANNNNYSILGSDSVTVLDLSDNTVVTTITHASFNQPYTVTINAAGTKAYVTNSNVCTITIIDIATNSVLGTIAGFDGPSGMVITPNGLRAYVNNYGGDASCGGSGSGNGTEVRVVDLTSDTIIGAAITVGLAPAALAITPDGVYVYVANYVDGMPGTATISVIETATNTVVTTINDSSLSGPFDIAITHDGTKAYIANFGSNDFAPYGTTVSVLDLSSNTIVDVITVGIQPSGLAITPDDRFAYVSNYNTLYAGPGFTNLTAGAGTVNIIDLSTNEVIPPTIAVDQSPDAIAISSDGRFAYVTNYISNTVNVIALPSFAITAQGCQTQNLFLTQKDIINKLSWSTSGPSLPVSYSIYRDAALTDLVAIVPATDTLQFLDHNVNPNVTYSYYLIGTNSAGTISDPVTITVTQKC